MAIEKEKAAQTAMLTEVSRQGVLGLVGRYLNLAPQIGRQVVNRDDPDPASPAVQGGKEFFEEDAPGADRCIMPGQFLGSTRGDGVSTGMPRYEALVAPK